MADLRITGVTTSHLELETQDGTKHTLEITEDLLKALKTRKPTTAGQALTPREIQEQLRLGKTVEQLIVSNPSDEDAIIKFGAPIVSELNHVVSLARNVRLNLATDRFADPAHIEFGLVMDDRLRTNEAKSLVWSSRKSADGQWLVTVDFQISDTQSAATWSFNPKQLLLTPENQTAIQLSNGMTLNISKSAEVLAVPKKEIPSGFVHPVDEPTEIADGPIALSVVPAFVEETPAEELPVDNNIQSRPMLRVMPEEPESAFESNYLDEPLGTVEDMVDVEEILKDEVIEQSPHVSETQNSPPATTSRWAEVLFGTKQEDEEKL